MSAIEESIKEAKEIAARMHISFINLETELMLFAISCHMRQLDEEQAKDLLAAPSADYQEALERNQA